MTRLIRWYDLLTLDHTVCKPCHSPFTGPGKAVRMVTDPAITKLRSTPGRKHVWTLKAKAALRRHLTEVHPELLPRVSWKKD